MESSNIKNVQIPNLSAIDPNDEALTRPVDQQIYISFDFYPVDNYEYHRHGIYGYHQGILITF